jgi:protein-disulfide isomerase
MVAAGPMIELGKYWRSPATWRRQLVGALMLAGVVSGGCSSSGSVGPGASSPPGRQPAGDVASVTAADSNDDRADGEPAPKIENPTLADIMAPGPLPERILGRADAPVALIEYVSLTCPYCRAFHDKVLADLKRDYIDKGKVRLIVREFPIGKTAGAATIVNRCMREDKYFSLQHRFLIEQKSWVSQEVRRDAIFDIARKDGMTRSEFDACFDNQQVIVGLKWVKERGRRLGVVGTPTFFVQDVKLRTAPSAEDIRRALDAALQKTASSGTAAPVR